VIDVASIATYEPGNTVTQWCLISTRNATQRQATYARLNIRHALLSRHHWPWSRPVCADQATAQSSASYITGRIFGKVTIKRHNVNGVYQCQRRSIATYMNVCLPCAYLRVNFGNLLSQPSMQFCYAYWRLKIENPEPICLEYVSE